MIALCIIKGEMKPLREKIRSLEEVGSNFSGVVGKRNTAVANLDNARERIEELQEKLKVHTSLIRVSITLSIIGQMI